MATTTDSGIKPRRQCDITRERNALARKTRVCEQCGVSFTEGKLSAKQIAAGHKQRFCSVACRADSRRVYSCKAEAKRAEQVRARDRSGLPRVGSVRACEVCGRDFAISSVNSRFCSVDCGSISYEAARVAREKARYEPRRFPCAECGKEHTTIYGATRQRFCSHRCMDKNVSRASKGVREARKRVRTIERVDPIEVFIRDGWRCQLCGERTPRRLRGTIDRMAPELDHIVPLAHGGEHSYRNTQCACRACNSAKGSKPLGQLRLLA